MKKAQAGLIGLVMMVAGIALVLGLGALLLGGFLLVADPSVSSTAMTVEPPAAPPATAPAPVEPSADPSAAPSAAGEKLALGVVEEGTDDAEASEDGASEDDASDAAGADDDAKAAEDDKAGDAQASADADDKEATAPAKAAEPTKTASATTSVSATTTAPTRSAPAPRKSAPTATKVASGGPATIKWTGKKPMVYTFTGADGKTYSGSRARLPAGTYGFAAAVSGLAPEKQGDVVVAKGASSITIHCDEGSKTCTQK